MDLAGAEMPYHFILKWEQTFERNSVSRTNPRKAM